MLSPGFTNQSFQLLQELKENNNKEWFDAHREQIKQTLQLPFATMLTSASAKMKNLPLPLSGGKETMFRLHRDIRFSKSKLPYKEHISGLLTPTGTKQDDGALLYAHLDCEGGFLAAGFYQLDTRSLNKIRDALLATYPQFEAIAKKLTSKGLAFMDEGKLTKMPQGYAAEVEHPIAEFLKFKNLVVHKKMSHQVWLDGSIVGELAAFAKATSELLVFGTEAIAS